MEVPVSKTLSLLFLLVFYLAFTRVSEIVIERMTRKLSHGQATAAGEAMRREA